MKREPLSREVRVLSVCQAVLSFGLGLAFPFFAIYLHRVRGLPMTWVGGGLSLAVAATALSQGLGGELSDRFGRRRIMILALWGRAVTVLALAYTIYRDLPIPLIIGMQLVSNFVSHFFEPASRGWIADYAGIRDRHRAYGLLRIATFAGFAVGPALGGLMADRSYAILFAASGLVCILCALGATIFLRSERPPQADSEEELSDDIDYSVDWNFMTLCFFSSLLALAMAQFVVPLSLWATKFVGLKDSQMGLLLSLNGLLVVMFQIPAVNLLAGVRLTLAIGGGCIMYAVGYAGVGFAGGIAGLVIAVVLLSGAEILVPSALQALAANMSPESVRGRWIGILGLSRQFGSALGPVVGCAAMEYAAARGFAGHWFGVSIVAIAAGFGFLILGRRLLPEEEGLLEEEIVGG